MDNITYDKAMTLMQGALKKFQDGNIEGGEKERKQANDMFDKARSEMQTGKPNDTMLYGENRNFGIIYKIVENNARRLFLTSKGKKALGAITRLIREDKTLSSQFHIYEALSHITPELKDSIGVDAYVSEAVKNMPTLSRKQIIESNEKLISLMRKHGIDEMIPIDQEDFELFESIECLMLTKPGLGSLPKRLMSENKIKSYMENSPSAGGRAEKMSEEDYTKKVNKLSAIYEHVLNDDEKRLVDVLSAKGDIEESFNDYKRSLTESIKSVMSKSSGEDLEELKGLLENVNSIKYSETDAIDNIVKLMKANEKINE